MYWICLSKDELDDTISALYVASQCDLTDRKEAEVYEKVQEKLEFFRDHENQETALWQFTAKFMADTDLPIGGETLQVFKQRLEQRKKGL